MKQCKCEHWQECPVCQPSRFDADGNRLPPEPTPLQAARAQIEKDTALLRQALEALEVSTRFVYADLRPQCEEAITTLRAALEEPQRSDSEHMEPVAAQHRFRHPQKGTPDWSVWQSCKVAQRPAWEIDSQGYEVEYRALYTAPQPVKREPLTDEEFLQLLLKKGTTELDGGRP